MPGHSGTPLTQTGSAERKSVEEQNETQEAKAELLYICRPTLKSAGYLLSEIGYWLFTLALSFVIIASTVPSCVNAATVEDSLVCLPGKFLVVGQEPDSGRTYFGFVSVSRHGDRLLIEKHVQRELISGTGIIAVEAENPVLEVTYHVGSHMVTAGFEFRWGSQSQPRASGWVSPVDGDLSQRNRLGLEVWYYDRAPPVDSPLILNRSANLFKKRVSAQDDLLGLLEGKFRVIGCEIDSGRVYIGRIIAKRNVGKLKITGAINGNPSSGELTLSPDRFLVVAKYRTGSQTVSALLNEQTVGDNYPRLCGYFYSLASSGAVVSTGTPRLETWFYDW
jgi:hypothetical protein